MSDESVARRAAAAPTLHHAKDLSRRAVLDLPVPDEPALAGFVAHVDAYDSGQGVALLDALIDEIDALVGDAFGLTRDDIQFIQQEMREDPFLRHIRPNLPHTGRRLRGLYESLASSDRYRSGS